MKFSDELKSKGLLEFENLVLQCNPTTNSAILSSIESGKWWGITKEREAWVTEHLGVRVLDPKASTIIKFEDAVGRRVPRWCIERHYYYFVDGSRAYQMTAYLNTLRYKEMDIQPVRELGYRQNSTLLAYNNGVVANYPTTVTYLDIPVLRGINSYCKAVNRYLRVAAAMDNKPCQIQGYDYMASRIVALAFTNQEPADKAALDVVQELQDKNTMQLVSVPYVYKVSSFAPTTSVGFLYVRQ